MLPLHASDLASLLHTARVEFERPLCGMWGVGGAALVLSLM